jgi:hypothetical protein
MKGHSDITLAGSPVGRVEVDTDKGTVVFRVLESVSQEVIDSILPSLKAIPNMVGEIEVEVVKDDHFFDLFS